MQPKLIALVVFIYVVAMIVGWASTGQNLFVDSNMTNPVEGVMSFGQSSAQESWGLFTIPLSLPQYFHNIWTIITLDFPIFQSGWWIIIRWLVLGPIIAMVVYGLISTFMSLIQRTV